MPSSPDVPVDAPLCRDARRRDRQASLPVASRSRSASPPPSCARSSTRSAGCVQADCSRRHPTLRDARPSRLVAGGPRVLPAGCSRDATPRAALGGITALQAAGLRGIADDGLIHVCAPKSSHPTRRRPVSGSTRPGAGGTTTSSRRASRAPGRRSPRSRLPVGTDRSRGCALLVVPVQQRLTTADAVSEVLERVQRDKRRSLLRAVDAGCHGRRALAQRARLRDACAAVAVCRNLTGRSSSGPSGRPGVPRRPVATVACGGGDRRHRPPAARPLDRRQPPAQRDRAHAATSCSACRASVSGSTRSATSTCRTRPPPGRLAPSTAELPPQRPPFERSSSRICGR